MYQNYKNPKYIICIYNITNNEYILLRKLFPRQHFKFINTQNNMLKLRKIEKLTLFDKPDILICDEGTEFDNNIKNILDESCCNIIKISNEYNINNFKSNDNIIFIKNKNGEYIPNLENTIIKIIETCQISNTNKVKKMTNDIIVKTINNIDKKNIFEEKNNHLNKDFLFKLADLLKEFIFLKDHYTAMHCERVAFYAEALGHELKLDNDQLENLILVGKLHDIGKIAIPDAIINKSSTLSDFEYELMKKHSKLGSDILQIKQFDFLNNIILCHHERYDGTGYPRGLKGNDIPLLSQILSIADSFDAMTSQRTYNNVKSAEEAFDDLVLHTKPFGVDGGLGIHYNPDLVTRFIKVISNSKTTMDELKNGKQLKLQKFIK